MKSIGYVRVSSQEQAESGLSLSAQKNKIRVYAELNDLNLAEIIEDAGISGKTTGREGLQKLLMMVEKKEIQAVVVYKLDRLSRKVIDTLSLIERFEKAGVAFHSIAEKIDTKSAIGKFFLTITAAFAEMERNVISERTSFALQEKRRQGKLAGKIPYGFNLAMDGETLIPNEQEQKTIGTIQKFRAQGLSYRKIGAELIRREIPTKNGGAWQAMTISNLCEVNL